MLSSKSLRQALLMGAATFGTTAAVSAISQPACAQEITRTYNIQAQDLNSALREFALQTGRDVLYPPAIVAGKQSNGAQGQLTERQTLEALLAGTGLRFEQTASNGYAVQDPSSPTQLGDARGRAAPSEAWVEDEEIVVVGTNIRGIYPSSSPVSIYTAESIEQTGAVSTAQFVEKLSQNLGTATPHGSSSVNSESITGVDLRGLGVGTTLVLMNGRRLSLANLGQSADVSLIPVSAIERVELLTDGASAIYGSDAIGGVVNFVLRDDFDGAETRLSYGGVSDGGLSQGNFTQTFGRQWGTGHGLVSYDFFSASALDRDDRSYSRSSSPGTLNPHDERQNLLATFSQDIGDRFVFSGDLALTSRDIKSVRSDLSSANPLNHIAVVDTSETEQYVINLGGDYRLTDSLNASLLASYAENEVSSRAVTTRFNDPSITPTIRDRLKTYSVSDLTAMLDGSLFELPGGDIRFSIGAGLLDENYSGESLTGLATGSEIGRRTRYGFAELYVPLVGPDQDVPLIHRLELNLAARYTDIEDTSSPSIGRDFGNATDPKGGILWAPLPSLALRATYGTSFRAPSLLQLDPRGSSNGAISTNVPLPIVGGTPSTLFSLTGVSPELRPEIAETYTAGFDFRPTSHPGFQVSATYYSIDYSDRIAAPFFIPSPLFAPSDFPELLARQPSAATIENLLRTSNVLLNASGVDLTDPAAAAAVFAADPNFWVFESRFRNLSLSRQDGFDITVSNRFNTSLGEITFGGQITRVLDYQQQALASKPPVTVVDTAGFPVDWRGRLYASLSRGGFDSTLSVNYIDDYANPNAPTGPADVESWTTFDLSLAYDFDRDYERGDIGGLRATLSIQNLFDEDPPFVDSFVLADRFGFDRANANALGRFIVFGLAKTW